MTQRQRSVRRARRQGSPRLRGYIVTWDVDCRNLSSCSRLKRFVFGRTVSANGHTYRYPGLVSKDGVRYLGQSVLFLRSDRVDEMLAFLRRERVDHVVTEAILGPIVNR